MSHPSPTGNGCTLEDCHTNLFALTDLSGIKWRKLAAETVPAIDPLDDPILVSFAKCIQSDILCVWRRVLRSTEAPALDHLPFSKELWVFWYGEEPANLDSILSSELKEVDKGSWDNGLSFECRTLLFKALHQLIERCLLSRNFVRLGKWFVQPYEQTLPISDKSAHLSFSFNYFLHGESTVCASIDVKQHPPVWRLAPHHLALAQSNHVSIQVILAPYGLNAMLTGHGFRENDQHGRKLLSEWNMFFPLQSPECPEGGNEVNKLPSLVEVIVAGVRMKYPSCFVFVCETEESPARMQAMLAPMTMPHRQQSLTPHHGMSSMALTPPTSPADASLLALGGEGSIKVMPTSLYGSAPLEASQAPYAVNTISQRIMEKVCQDCCVTAGAAKRLPEVNGEEASAGVWELSEPTSRCNCSCSRHKATKSRSGNLGTGKGSLPAGKHAKGDKGDKLERQMSRQNRSMTPFHRRSPMTDDVLQFDMDMTMARLPPNPALRGSQAGAANDSTPTPTALPQLPRNPSVEANVESPSSAPSPLDKQHNQGVMNQTMEPTMPTLSPHPPSKQAGDREGATKLPNQAGPENSTLCNGSAEGFGKPGPDWTTVSLRQEGSGVSPVNGGVVDQKHESVNSWLCSQRLVDTHGIKRPCLPEKDLSEEELVTDSFYDYKSMHSWFEFPLKRARLEAKGDLKQGQGVQHQSPSNQKQKPKPPTPQPKNDPYEFKDDASLAIGGFSRFRSNRDDSFPRPSPFSRSMDEDSRDSMQNDDKSSQIDLNSPSAQASGRLFTHEKDLEANYKDLEHMFESDEDNEDPFLPPTPAGENRVDDIGVRSIQQQPGNSIAQSELTRMFPTPPSLSENATHSPGMGTDIAMETSTSEGICPKVEPFTGVTVDITSKYWSYVFKAPKYCQFLGSSKYAPVELPSGSLSSIPSPPDYKASWQYAIPMDKHLQPPPSTYVNLPSIENVPSLSRLHAGMIESSPATFHNSVQQRTPRTPMSYELQSPASNASSYMNRTLNSIDNQGTNNQIAEVHSLVVNIMLMDSLLNIFKDHNFDSCNICVCNMDIKGADYGLYLPPDEASESGYRCSCGFSAIMNRKYGHNSGLFYEDEVNITGIRNDRFDRRKPALRGVEFPTPSEASEHKDASSGQSEEDVTQAIMELLLGQYLVSIPSCSVVHLVSKLMTDAATGYSGSGVDMLQIQDGNEVAYAALEQGRQAMEHCSPTKNEDALLKASCIHKWPYLQGANRVPTNSQDVVRLLKSLLPLLQDAIQKKRTTRLWEPTYSVTGPLSWKDFHKMAGRGNDESCEPQPIPSFLVGHDKEWMSVSPFALKYWDKLLLEPYGKPRDIAYVVVAPDNDYVLTHVKRFFKELSTIYELSRLGRHSPISKVLRDGIMRVGEKTQKLFKEPMEDWFQHIGDSPVAAKLRLYAQTCRYHLGPHLAQQTLDKHLLESTVTGQQRPPFRPHPEPSPKPPATPDNSTGATTPQHGGTDEAKDGSSGMYDSLGQQRECQSHDLDQEDNGECPALVVYLVDPFTYGHQWDNLNRLAMVGLLRCYQNMLRYLPEHLQNNICLQIVPLKMIVDKQDSGAEMQHLKSLAFSVFTMCRWNLSHIISGRSLTGIGPASAAEGFLKKKGGDKAGPVKLYAPPYVLAPLKDKQLQLAESCGERLEKSNIIFCGYCLSEDQRWLLVTCTDERGEIMETCTINIEIPNRNRRRKASARKIGLSKLWDFILGIISMTTMPCRVVIGRFGRLGHGELKGWAGILSRKNLMRASKQLREICGQCAFLSNSDIPCVLSACLVSLEPQPTFKIMPDSLKIEEKMSSNCPLQTPRDVSCTHILVFPTSTTAQANTQPNHQEPTMDLAFNLPDEAEASIWDDIDPDLDLNNIFFDATSPQPSPPDAMQNVNSITPGGSPIGIGQSPGKSNGPTMAGGGTATVNAQEEDCNLLQQPLAMGYYTSTAKTGPLPKWFWSACPEAENNCPVMFKSALHIHCPSVQQNQDELIHSTPHSRNAHSLDSSLTCDVLRYVLENYNALSWLNLDPACNDRRSCLPIHFVILMQIYHALNACV